jgi:hypothetical protein
MSIIALVVVLILVGAGLYLVGVLPIDATIKTIIRVVVIVAACLWVLSELGALGGVKLHLH